MILEKKKFILIRSLKQCEWKTNIVRGIDSWVIHANEYLHNSEPFHFLE